jgi:tetratricopeptide (TPR) repeat protein
MKSLRQNIFKNNLAAILLLSLMFLTFWTASGCSGGAEKLYREGDILMQEGKLDEASAKFSEYIKKKPKDPRGYVALSDIMLMQASLTTKSIDLATLQDKSFALLQKAKKVAPKSEIPHVGLGRFYLSMGQIERAKIEFNQARELNPKNPEPNYMLGVIYAGEGNIKDAEIVFKEIIKTCSRENSEHKKAITVAYAGLLEFIGMEARTDGESLGIINDAISFKPDYSRSYAVRGIYNYKVGKINNAIEDFNKALGVCEKSEAFAHKILGRIYEKKGDKAQAVKHYHAFVSEFETDPGTGLPDGRDSINERDISRIKAYTGIDPDFRDLKAVRNKIRILSSEG